MKKSKVRYILFLSLFLPFVLIGQVEICDNGIDDDGDNLIDLNDDDCICTLLEPISLIPNPSFEELNCCPSSRSQLNCAKQWIQASEATTDHIHNCGWLGWPEFPPPQPFPDGNGIMGFRDGRVRGGNNGRADPYWKEYAGACLNSPLLAGSLYKIQFDVGFVNPLLSPPINISFFGTTSCNYLPFGIDNEAFGCPSNSPNWKKLSSITVSGGDGNKWVNTFLEIKTEEDIYAIAIGPDCSPVTSPVSIYYFFDNLILADIRSFNLKIKETAHPCSKDYSLFVPFNADFKYQWYLSGVALKGEVSSKLGKNYGEGSYQIRILDGTSCKVSAKFEHVIPKFDVPAVKAICEGDFYQFGKLKLTKPGIYVDTFYNQNNCDSIVALQLVVIGQQFDTLSVSILEGETYEIGDYSLKQKGDYPLILTSFLGCDSLVLLKLSTYNVFIPNVFSPNFDGINDIFRPIALKGEIRFVSMLIYDRWGNIVYNGAEWDGTNTQNGVYAYNMLIEFMDGNSKRLYGDVTLLR
jgi:gliding motility-associated-like protein